MNIVATGFTVADFCHAIERREIVVNREYQRSDKVWPPAARSYLIETILSGYPIPKLFLYQVTDVKTRKTFKEIVDGQQRSMAIMDFYTGKLRLSKETEQTEISGKTYSELDSDFQHRFLDYQITVDLFVSASPEEVREVFRRMNSYTVPLNPEEHRHASYQGHFKWFIQKLARRFGEAFMQMGLFGQQQLVRMADTKLLAEVCHAFLYGISTTTKAKLDTLYRDKDKSFTEEKAFEYKITEAIDQLLEWNVIHSGNLMKSYIVYSLILAITHMRSPVASLNTIFPSQGLPKFDATIVMANLTALSDALENQESPDQFRTFVSACSSKTNVRDQREIRFTWLCKALLPELL